MSDARALPLLAELVAEWLADRTGHDVAQCAAIDPRTFATVVGGTDLLIAVEPVGSAPPAAGFEANCSALARRLEHAAENGCLIWIPPGAEPPAQEPAASDAVHSLHQALQSLAPGERGEARLPISIGVRKREDQGAYVSAFGGLAPYWAQFTDRVHGYFHIDSLALHRLPEDEADTRALVDRLVEAANGLAVDQETRVEAEDTWRVQRLRRGAGCGVLALEPGDESESGSPMRRRLRVVLRAAGQRLAAHAYPLRLLALYGHYQTLDGEPVGPALRGQDPALFAGLDQVLLIADGQVRPLLDITRRAELQPKPSTA